MKKLLIRLSIIPLIPVLGFCYGINIIYWMCTGYSINADWLENWINSVEDEMS